MDSLQGLQSLIDRYLDLRNDWGVALDILVVVLAVALINLLLRVIFTALYRHVRDSDNRWDDAIYRSLNGPLQGVVWVAGLTVAVRLADPAQESLIAVYLPALRNVLIIVVIAWFAFRLITGVERNALARMARRGNPIDLTTADAIGKAARGSVLVLAGLSLLPSLGVPLSALLAFGGVGGIALGFAARDVLANLFGGLMIYLNRPFSVGDWIRSPDREIEGVVEAIGWRATTLRRFDMRPLYVPNAIFSNVALENPSRMTHRRIFETIALRYDDAAAVPDIVQAIRAMLDSDDAIDSDQVVLTYLDSLGDSALNLLVYCYTRTTDWAEYLAVKQSVLQRCQDIIREHGAVIAYPTTTLHVPGEVIVADDRPPGAADDDQEQPEIDRKKVESEREEALERQIRNPGSTNGPDNP